MRESIYRALRTFIQTAVGYIAVNIALIDFTNDRETVKSLLIGLLISSISAGLSGVMNYKEDGFNENGRLGKA